MKKFHPIFLTVLGLVFCLHAKAQSGLNNNSNWKTPIPNIILPQSPTGGGNNFPTNAPPIQNTIQLPALPTLPPLTIINTPISIPNFASSSIFPSLPTTPSVPMAPTANFVASMPVAVPLVSLPLLPTLPPVPPIAPVPELRLVLRP